MDVSEARLNLLDARIAELETTMRKITVARPGSGDLQLHQRHFSHGSCTNDCTYGCTGSCTGASCSLTDDIVTPVKPG